MHKHLGISKNGRVGGAGVGVGGYAASYAGPAVLFAVDAEGVFTLFECGDLMGTIPGSYLGGMVGRSVFDAYQETPAVTEGVRRALAGESVVEQGGGAFRCSYSPLRNGEGAVVGVVGTVGCAGPERTVGGAERGLKESEERFRLVARATKEAIWDSDLVADRQAWDGAVEAVLGYPARQVTDTAWWEERVHPDDRGRVLGKVEAALKGGREAWFDEYRFLRADGAYAIVLDRAIIVRDPFTTRPVRMLGSMADVTEKRRAEETLRESEELFRHTFEAAAIGMAHVSLEGGWLRVNDELCRIVGYERKELLSLTFSDITHPADLDADLEHVGRMLRGKIRAYSMEKRYVRKDRSHVWVELTVSLVRDAKGEPGYFVSVVEDINDRKLRELVPNPLSLREIEVLCLVAKRKTNAEIACALKYSVATVKLHVQRVLAKLGAKSRSKAAARATDIGLIPPPKDA